MASAGGVKLPSGSWQAQASINGKTTYLGVADKPEKARRLVCNAKLNAVVAPLRVKQGPKTLVRKYQFITLRLLKK